MSYSYKNVEDLIMKPLREKIFEKSEFDESFSDREIELIDSLIEKSIRKKKYRNLEKYLSKI